MDLLLTLFIDPAAWMALLSLVMGILLYTTSITRLEMKRFRYLDTPRSPPA